MPFAIAVLRTSYAVLNGRTDVLDSVFAVALKARAPHLAATAHPGLASRIARAVAGEDLPPGGALPELDLLLRDARFGPRASGLVGQALMSGLAFVLGPAFDEPARDAWSEAYAEFVRGKMAVLWNRMDFVA